MPPPPPERASTRAGTGARAAETTGGCLPRRSRQHERQPSLSKASPAGSPTPNRLRNPLWRYALMSVVLVGIGLAVRYLWRQLAGLVGATLILSTVGRLPGRTPAKRSSTSPGAAAVASAQPPAEEPRREPSSKQGGNAAEPTPGGGGDGGGRGGGAGFADAPAELHQYWADGGPGCSFFVRGPKYLVDKKKVGRLSCDEPCPRFYLSCVCSL